MANITACFTGFSAPSPHDTVFILAHFLQNNDLQIILMPHWLSDSGDKWPRCYFFFLHKINLCSRTLCGPPCRESFTIVGFLYKEFDILLKCFSCFAPREHNWLDLERLIKVLKENITWCLDKLAHIRQYQRGLNQNLNLLISFFFFLHVHRWREKESTL